MAENAYEYLKSVQPSLIKRLDENLDVCDFLIAFYKHVESASNESANDPANLICTVDIIQERLLRIRTSYYEPGQNKTSTNRHPSNRNLNIVKLFEVNRNVRDVAARVVEILERWLDEKPYRKEQGWKNVKLVNGMHWAADHTFTIEIVLKFEFDEFVAAKMKWNMDEPEQPTVHDVALATPEEIDLEWRSLNPKDFTM